jgi:hypothetical protein
MKNEKETDMIKGRTLEPNLESKFECLTMIDSHQPLNSLKGI